MQREVTINEDSKAPIRVIAAVVVLAFTIGGWAAHVESSASAHDRRLDVQRDKLDKYSIDINEVKSDLKLIKYKLGIHDEKE